MASVRGSSLSIALLTALLDPEEDGLRSPLVQDLLREALTTRDDARDVMVALLASSGSMLRQISHHNEQTPLESLQKVALGFQKKVVELGS
ncbi:hypothetical protein [Antribacter gilvus]|uniref:hypothetical protein n=1 Tax=Antribacter gilvus TaxID=2304675 RepID=UPI000F7AE13C|nr:hypothetical protein [Antribacter gilvus]